MRIVPGRSFRSGTTEVNALASDFKDLFDSWPSDPNTDTGLPFGTTPEIENRFPTPLTVSECKVVNVFEVSYEVSEGDEYTSRATFVLLQDESGRQLRIFVMPDVASAIQQALEGIESDRPSTHDLTKSIIEALDATVTRITVDDIWQDTPYAKITLSCHGIEVEIDSRPSDAIAIALRFHARIFVSDAILENQHE
jgi:uncharacterized protein